VNKAPDPAGREFRDCPPQLDAAIDAANILLKKLRGLRNKGRAAEADVEDCRRARDLLVLILRRAGWRGA